MTAHHDHAGALSGSSLLVGGLLVAAALLYVTAVRTARGRGRHWPNTRTALWLLGLVCAACAVVGPIAEQAHADLRAHMVGHVLLGMLAPLLMALAAPVTLALRALPPEPARRVARVLRSAAIGILIHPVTAAVLDIGGLWVLYRTGLYEASMQSPLVHALVHAHVFLAGYLFTFALVGPDPNPHRARLPVRVTVLALAIAAHNVLAKLIYAYPSAAYPSEQAHAGAQIMYYGGAPVELTIIVLLGLEWLRRQDHSRAVTERVAIAPS
jgi:putative membrane protein